MKQKLCRLLNTEFSLMELRLDDQRLENYQVGSERPQCLHQCTFVTIQVLGKLGGEQKGKLDIHLSIMEPSEELESNLKLPTFSKEEGEEVKRGVEEDESFDAFLARQPQNPRPRLIYQPEKDLLEKDEREGTMGRFDLCKFLMIDTGLYFTGTRKRTDY